METQIEWIKNNPDKTPKYEEKKIVQANFIFNNGDICENTGKPRYQTII